MRSEDQTLNNVGHIYKIGVVGSASSGKSSLIHKAATPDCPEEMPRPAQLETQHFVHELDDERYRLQAYESLQSDNHYRCVQAIIICVDLTSEESLRQVRHWHRNLEQYSCENTPIILVGTKGDLKKRK